MFIDETFKKYKIEENNTSLGILEVNEELVKNGPFYKPFAREKNDLQITKIGVRDYGALNKFIITSMNDYYARLMNASGIDRKTMLNAYNRMYGMWRELHNYKKSNNLVEMDTTYDLFSYELYVLGYTN